MFSYRVVSIEQAGDLTLEVELPEGEYAVSVYQDLNGNKKLDRVFGLPKEPYGFSNDVHTVFRAPVFSAAAVRLSGDSTIVIPISAARIVRIGE